MVTIQTLTTAIVVAFGFGALVGCAIMGIASGDSYKKGKEDEYNRIMSKLEEYQKGDAA